MAAILNRACASNHAEVGDRVPDGLLVDGEHLGARRHPVGGRADRRRLLVGVEVREEPAEIDARVLAAPELPVDDRHHVVAPREQVAEPVLTVHDGRRHRFGNRGEERLGGVAEPGSQVVGDRLEHPDPPLDLVDQPDLRLVGETHRVGRHRVQPTERSRRREQAGPEGRRRGEHVAGVEQRFERLTGDELHGVERRDLGRLAGIGEAHGRDRRAPGPHDGVLHPCLPQDVAVARGREPGWRHLDHDRLAVVELHQVGEARLAPDQGTHARRPPAGAPRVDERREPRLQPTRGRARSLSVSRSSCTRAGGPQRALDTL